jgi:hypothetical protein
MNIFKTLKEPVFAFWFILATWDFVATSISVFLLHGGEGQFIPRYIIQNYGFIGYILSSIAYLYIMLFIYYKIQRTKAGQVFFIGIGGIHSLGAVNQTYWIVASSTMIYEWNIQAAFFASIPILAFIVGKKCTVEKQLMP